MRRCWGCGGEDATSGGAATVKMVVEMKVVAAEGVMVWCRGGDDVNGGVGWRLWCGGSGGE
nr:hypothetical protein [Tanacetum cinerariifolium]